jgi:hypothetical protein
VADQDVVDQFTVPFEPAGEPLVGRDAVGQVPQPEPVALVGTGEAGGVQLGARWAVEDLGGGRRGFVVEVAQHDHRVGPPVLPIEGQQPGGQAAEPWRLRRPARTARSRRPEPVRPRRVG